MRDNEGDKHSRMQWFLTERTICMEKKWFEGGMVKIKPNRFHNLARGHGERVLHTRVSWWARNRPAYTTAPVTCHMFEDYPEPMLQGADLLAAMCGCGTIYHGGHMALVGRLPNVEDAIPFIRYGAEQPTLRPKQYADAGQSGWWLAHFDMATANDLQRKAYRDMVCLPKVLDYMHLHFRPTYRLGGVFDDEKDLLAETNSGIN